jgi:signal transduction histidine kinase
VRLRLTITRRITVLWTALFACGLLAYGLAASQIVEREGREALDVDLATRAQEALNAAAHNQPPSVIGDAGVVVLRGTRTIAASGFSAPPGLVALPVGMLTHGASVNGYRAVELADARERAIAFASEATLAGEAQRIREGFLIASIPVLALSALAGFLLARRSLRPVDEITRLARSVAASGDLHRRLALRSEDELGRLAATFDAMLERLEASFARERAFVGDVSHELRTAVAAITAIAEVTLGRRRDSTEYREALDSIVRRGRTLTRVIDDLLLLARADAGVLPTSERADVNEIVAAVGADAQRSTTLPVEVSVSEDPLVIRAAGDLVARALDNVVSNALRHARLRTTIGTERRNGSAIVIIDDDGPGIPADERGDVFRRFYRSSARYEGSGIGLALTASVVRAYGGEITVLESPLGGARFTVTLPLAP